MVRRRLRQRPRNALTGIVSGRWPTIRFPPITRPAEVSAMLRSSRSLDVAVGGAVEEVLTVPGREAERVAGGVQVHEAVIGIGLELECGRPGGERPRAGRFRVVYEEIEMHLHRHGIVRPGRGLELVDLLEGNERVRAGDRCPAGGSPRDAVGD